MPYLLYQDAFALETEVEEGTIGCCYRSDPKLYFISGLN